MAYLGPVIGGGGYCDVVRPGAPSAGGEQPVLWSGSMLSMTFPTCRSLCPRRHGESVGAVVLPILGECGAEETRFVHSLDTSLLGTVHPARSHAGVPSPLPHPRRPVACVVSKRNYGL